MPEFVVRHAVVVEADTPAAATEAARAAQARDAPFSTVFEVLERLPGQRLGPPVEVDLQPGDLDKLTALMKSLEVTALPCDHGGVRRPVEICECGAFLDDGAELATVGMLDVTPGHTGWGCLAECHPLGECTLEAGHTGQHIATDGRIVIGVKDATPW